MDLAAMLQRSPYHRWLGLEMVKADAGEVHIRLPYRSEFQGDDDGANIHGGIIASLADTAACFAVISAAGFDVPTLDLRLDYLRMAPVGHDLLAVGRTVKTGRTISVADVEVRSGDKVVAVGRGSFLSVPPAK